MADNKYTVTVEVTDNGKLRIATDGVGQLGEAVKKTNSATKDFTKSHTDLFDTQAKGVIGTANSTKSFSKLAETINGSSGLVGAYATLAANTFAVTAAFNALKQAAQLDQIFRGLEASGARSGQSLDVAADKLRAVTGNAISMKQALTSTAQVMSGGFSTKDLTRLGQVAKDASFALGRDMTDSLDRLTRGVVKLEPELLDELGIMTKINDSNAAYAVQLGKSESSLTNFQKRQGFLNAVIQEATLKFGGLSDAAGNSKAYDQLAASFENLKNDVLGLINSAIVPLISFFAGNETSLAGVAVLFASTISKQLLPGIADLSARTARAADAAKEHAAAVREEAAAHLQNAMSMEKEAVAAARANVRSIDKGPSAFNDNLQKIQDNEAGARDAALKTLQRSADARARNIASLAADNPALASRQKMLDLVNEQISAIKALQTAEEQASMATKAAIDNDTSARLRQVEADKLAASQQGSANAIAAASSGGAFGKDYGAISKGFKDAVANYTEALIAANELSSQEDKSAEFNLKEVKEKFSTLTQVLSQGFKGLAHDAGYTAQTVLTIGERFKVVGFAAGQAFKIAGAALLDFIPVIGQAIFVFGLLSTLWDSLKSDSLKEAEEAAKALSKTVGETAGKVDALHKAMDAGVNAGLRTQQTITIQSNAVRELSEAYADATKKREDYDKTAAKGTGVATLGTLLKSGGNIYGTNAQKSYSTGLRQDNPFLNLISETEQRDSRLGNLTQAGTQAKGLQAAVATLGSMYEVAPKATNAILKVYGGLDGLSKLDTEKKIDAISKAVAQMGTNFEDNAQLVANLVDSLKNADTALTQFMTANAVNTPFTAAAKSLETVGSAIDAIKTKIKEGGKGLEEWNRTLEMVGAGTQKLMNPAFVQSLNKFKTNDSTAQSLLTQGRATDTQREVLEGIEEAGKLNKQSLGVIDAQVNSMTNLTREQKNQLVSSVMYLTTHQNIHEQLEDELNALKEQFIQLEKASVLDQHRIQLAQAYLTATQAIMSATGAGELDRLNRQNQIIKLQEHQLDLQLQLYKQQQSQADAMIDHIRNNEVISAQMKEQAAYARILFDTDKARNAYSVQKANTSANGVLNATGQAAKAEAKAFLDDARKNYAEQQKQAAIVVEGQDKIKGLRDGNRQIDLQINALATQRAVLEEGITTQAQNQAQAAKIDLQFLTQKQQLLTGQRDTLNSTYDQAVKIDRLVNRTGDSVVAAIADLAQARNRSLQSIDAKYSSTIATTQNDIAQAKADSAKLDAASAQDGQARIAQLQDQLNLQQSSMEAEKNLADLTFKAGVYEKVLVDVRKEGLTYQQQALEYIDKQLQAQKSLADAAREYGEASLKVSLASRGQAFSEGHENALKIDAANQAYQQAVRESQVRLATIDAEYALLEAQRQLMREQLADRARVLKDLNDPAFAGQIEQLTAAINNLDNANLEVGKNAAKQAANLSVMTARANLDLLTRRQVDPNDTFSRIQGRIAERQARAQARDTLRNPPEAVSVAGVRTPAQVQTDKFAKIAESADAQRKTLDGQITTVITLLGQIATNTAKAGDPNLVANSNNATMKQIIDYFVSKGYTVAQSAGIAGNAQQESGLDPHKVNSIGMAGLFQFSKANQAEFQKQFGHSVIQSTVEEQLKFVSDQLNGTEGAAKKLLLASTDIASAAVAFRKGYERPGESEANDAARIRYAKSAVSGAANDNTPDIVVTARNSPMKPVATPNMDADLPTQSADAAVKAVPSAPTIGKATMAGNASTGVKDSLDDLNDATALLSKNLENLGPDGAPFKALLGGINSMGPLFDKLTDRIKAFSVDDGASSLTKFSGAFVAAAEIASTALSSIQSAVSATAQNQENAIDTLITAEQNRDGKSAQSVAKIQALEKQKDEIAKRQFNTNKKLMMAQAIIATAAGIAQALTLGPIAGPILAGIIGAMGAAQIAIISGTQYQSTYAPAQATQPTTLTIGKQGDTVDLAKQNTNVGGELGYLRGSQGTGSTASNYSVIGSAYGGPLPRGYGNTAYVVGEKGPETIVPMAPMTVQPANDNRGVPNVNATVNIHALDAAGVEDVLQNQRGNLISMFREAANANGQPFLENVNVNAYSRPNATAGTRL